MALDALLKLLTVLPASMVMVCMWWLFRLLRSVKNYYFFNHEAGVGIAMLCIPVAICAALCGAALLARRTLRRRGRIQYRPLLDLATACLLLLAAATSLALVTQAIELVNPSAARCGNNFECASSVPNRK